MHIVHVASEFAPLIKAGGLADVVHGLSCELVNQGHKVQVIVPLYKFLDKKKLQLNKLIEKFVICEKNIWHNNAAYCKIIDDIEVIFIEMHHPDKYFWKDNIYGYESDILRFIYFSRAALEFLLIQKQTIDILNIHDWHTSICTLLEKDILKHHHLQIKATVLTVHNFHYQGKCATIDLDNIGLNGEKYLTDDLLKDSDSNFPMNINLLKGAIVFADAIVTVSKSYAKELLNNQHTYGLHKVIKKNKKKLFGILNGLDIKKWNPSTDKSIFFNYSEKKNIKEGKEKNKQALIDKLNLKESKKPLFIFIGRLVKQKGIDILEYAIDLITKKEGLFILCGSAVDNRIQTHFDSIKSKYSKFQNTHFHFDYNDKLARQLYAGADFIIVPSLFEPCGLVQLIAMRYGTIPIVRKTGGLSDSVEDFELNTGLKNGIVFEEFNEEAINLAINRAFSLNQNNRKKETLRQKIMQFDFSWHKSAYEYTKLYEKISS